MEGVGSRQSRASARYGPGPSAAVFNGPVRKWKKQWVSSPSNNGNNRNDVAPLILCRWTPLDPADAADEPRKRRFRYAPVVPIEKGKMEALERFSNEARTNTMKRSNSDGVFEKPSLSPEENQEPNEDQEDSNKSPGFDLS